MTQKPLTVRAVQPEDEDKLFDLLCLAYKENSPYSMNEKKVRLMIAEGAHDKEAIIGVIDSPDGKTIVGSIGATFSQYWYTDDWHIGECWNFVHPDHRRTNHANDLIDYVKWIAEQMAMPLHIGILTSTRMEAKIRLYKKKMRQVGAFFIHNMESINNGLGGEGFFSSPILTKEDCETILRNERRLKETPGAIEDSGIRREKIALNKSLKKELMEIVHG